jgi:hypothetical protein
MLHSKRLALISCLLSLISCLLSLVSCLVSGSVVHIPLLGLTFYITLTARFGIGCFVDLARHPWCSACLMTALVSGSVGRTHPSPRVDVLRRLTARFGIGCFLDLACQPSSSPRGIHGALLLRSRISCTFLIWYRSSPTSAGLWWTSDAFSVFH